MKAGDLLFFSGLGHVGLYLGHGRMVHAPHSGRNVEVVRLRSSNYGSRLVGARRITPA
jgi:cell wall-associated NlpC family hydrolase